MAWKPNVYGSQCTRCDTERVRLLEGLKLLYLIYESIITCLLLELKLPGAKSLSLKVLSKVYINVEALYCFTYTLITCIDSIGSRIKSVKCIRQIYKLTSNTKVHIHYLHIGLILFFSIQF